MADLAIDAALLQRVQGQLPDDPAKDTQEQADLRKLLALAGYVCLIAPQAAQRVKDAGDFLKALIDPFGALAQVEQP